MRRWVEEPAEIPGPAEQALRAWFRLNRLGMAWRPDGLPLGEDEIDEMAKQLALNRRHAIHLDVCCNKSRPVAALLLRGMSMWRQRRYAWTNECRLLPSTKRWILTLNIVVLDART